MPIQYVGNKQKFAKDILKVILPGNEHRVYCEPFVGSAAFLIEVPTHMTRFANDKNPYMVALHEATRDGWTPPSEVSEEEYTAIRRSPGKYPPELVGFVSVGCSFGGKMWGGYARCKDVEDKRHLDGYAAMSSRSVLKGKDGLQGVTFICGEYYNMPVPDGALVYCDPPYSRTTEYEYGIDDAGGFKRWCEGLVGRGCQVFISGYKHNKLSGWDIVWSMETHSQLGRNEKSSFSKRVEVVFQHHSQSGMTQEVLVEEQPQQDMCPNCCSIDPEEFGVKCSESYHKWHDEAALTTERNAA